MTKAPSKKPKRAVQVEDEPGADQRFSNILKRALNTPPKRKQQAVSKAKRKTKDRS